MGSCYSSCEKYLMGGRNNTDYRFPLVNIMNTHNDIYPFERRDDDDQFQNLDSSDSSLDVEIERLNLFYSKYGRSADENTTE